MDLEKGRELLRRYDAMLTVPPLPFDRFVPGRFIRYLEPETRTPLAVPESRSV